MIQIPLEEEKFSPLRFFFWKEPIKISLTWERTFKSPSLEAAALNANQFQSSLRESRRSWVMTWSQEAKSGLLVICNMCVIVEIKKKRSSLAGCQH